MTVYIATKNAGKLRELRTIVSAANWDARSYEAYADVAETGTSYAENAALKARALHARLRANGIAAATLADDSGLEVDALGGRPGLRSARYGGPMATWPRRRSMLLAELAGVQGPARSARFVCALHFIDTAGRETRATGTYDGTIARKERGHAGFSYDAIFTGADGRTFAEVSDDEKNRISHRSLAAAALFTALAQRP